MAIKIKKEKELPHQFNWWGSLVLYNQDKGRENKENKTFQKKK